MTHVFGCRSMDTIARELDGGRLPDELHCTIFSRYTVYRIGWFLNNFYYAMSCCHSTHYLIAKYTQINYSQQAIEVATLSRHRSQQSVPKTTRLLCLLSLTAFGQCLLGWMIAISRLSLGGTESNNAPRVYSSAAVQECTAVATIRTLANVEPHTYRSKTLYKMKRKT